MAIRSGLGLFISWISIIFLFITMIIISINHSSIIYSETFYRKSLQTSEARIDDYINTFIQTTNQLALDEGIINSLSNSIEREHSETKLFTINNTLQTSIIYIMDPVGDVISSSDSGEVNSIKGKNYSFREYFTEAIQGNNEIMMAVGVTTGIRGIYFSSPIIENNEIIGVLVIKVSLDRIDQIISNSPVYTDIITDSRKIFSSREQRWIHFHSSVTDSLESLNTLTMNLNINQWQIRMIYSKEDLVKTPGLYISLIIIIGSLLFVMISITLLLLNINRKKQQVEIRLYERKKEIIRINANLEEKIKERTSELKYTQKQLVEAEKMASLGNLVAGVSHEINTPIGVSLMASTFLKNQINEILSGEVKPTKNHLNNIQESSELIINNIRRASEIIRTFKQVTGETIIEEPRVLNVKDHITETISSLVINNGEIKPSIQINCSENIHFSTYPLAFYHIFNNLVNNTIKHGFSGHEYEEIEITINKSDDQLMVIYHDNGSGMNDDTCSKIFDPFFTTKRGRGGTGLGMHIVYNIIVKLFKGDISCQSKPGKGTSFTIYLSPVQ